MDDILKASVADPRGEKMLAELAAQDLSVLSVADLEERLSALKAEIARCEEAKNSRAGATAAAEALFKS